ncbi:hypothetical protein M0D21_12890 [Aquimarina sp. D1M17]|uniref:hypothetical protein n=1 Tax=Aquimarina acroporae TaxID=2937283 RepID=UPI0020C0A607|nr:hypothetical protein [Aquimarina acroporae]MCK8522473.1 hypothetical protein [Aquimarina acroporae]
MKILKYIFFIVVITLQSCGGSDDSPAPLELGSFSLLFPINNEICTEGAEITNDMVSIPFNWGIADNATSYVIEVTNTKTGEKYEENTSTNSGDVIVPKGIQFTWKVTAYLNGESKDSNDIWNFYSEGITTSNHIPFPAKITLQDNKNSTINILWEGLDLDNDIDGYDIYMQNSLNSGNPELIQSTSETSILNFTITYDVVYDLEIITKDKNGNTSSSKRTFKFTN